MSLDEQLQHRLGLFAYDLIGKVISQAKSRSDLSDKDDLYEKISTRWKQSLSKIGGIPISVPQPPPLIEKAALNQDPRLSAPLPPLSLAPNLRAMGRPPSHFILQDTAEDSSAIKKPSIKKKYIVKDHTALHCSAMPSVQAFERVSEEEVQALFTRPRKRPLESANHSDAALERPSQDILVGSLLLLDLTKVSIEWLRLHHIPLQCRGSPHSSSTPVRVIKIYKKPKSSDISVTFRFSSVHTQYIEQYVNMKIEAEPTLPWPHVALTLPFSSSHAHAPNHILDSSNVEIDEVGDNAGSHEGHGESMEKLLEDVLDFTDDLEVDLDKREREVLSDALHQDINGILSDLNTMSGSVLNGKRGRSLSQYGEGEGVVLLTGEEVSQQAIDELEEYYARLKKAKKRYYTDKGAEYDETVIEEDVDVPLPTPDIQVVGKLMKLVNYQHNQWTVRLEDVIITHESQGIASNSGAFTTSDVILPIVNIKVNTRRLLGEEQEEGAA